jgi:photosynthetic reaction center H subunit
MAARRTGERKERDVAATATAGWVGAPLHPTDNPMLDGVGPAA